MSLIGRPQDAGATENIRDCGRIHAHFKLQDE